MEASARGHARWWLAAIVAFALAARWYHLASWDVWTDEVQTLLTSADLSFQEGPMYRTAPINFLLTGAAMRLLGASIASARSVSLVAGVLTVPLTYAFAAKRFGTRPALFASALLATSMWHVFWSQTARHFALEALLLLAAAHLLLRCLEGRGTASALGAAALMTAALFTHSSAGFYVGTLLLYAGWRWRAARRRAGPGADEGSARRSHAPTVRAAATAVAACALPLAVYVPVYIGLGRYLLENKAPWNPWWNIAGSLVFYLPPALLLAAAGGALALWRARDPRGALLAAFFVLPAGLVIAASTQTIASAAYALPALPAIAVLVGVAADAVLDAAATPAARAAAAGLVAALFAVQAYQLAHYYLFYNGLKPRWADATSYVASNWLPGERLYASEGDVAAYYLGEERTGWLGEADEDSTASGRWFAAYLDERLTADPQATSSRIGDAALVATFPLHYGAKDRTIGVYHRPPGDSSAEGPAGGTR